MRFAYAILSFMKVFYDVEINDVTLFYENHSVILDYFDKIKDFIEQKLDVLINEIHTEELFDELSCTILYVLSGERCGTVEFNYSDKLIPKIKSCFSDADWKYLSNMLSRS